MTILFSLSGNRNPIVTLRDKTCSQFSNSNLAPFPSRSFLWAEVKANGFGPFPSHLPRQLANNNMGREVWMMGGKVCIALVLWQKGITQRPGRYLKLNLLSTLLGTFDHTSCNRQCMLSNCLFYLLLVVLSYTPHRLLLLGSYQTPSEVIGRTPFNMTPCWPLYCGLHVRSLRFLSKTHSIIWLYHVGR